MIQQYSNIQIQEYYIIQNIRQILKKIDKMTKKNTKKQVKKSTSKAIVKKGKQKNKLDPGKKHCKNCKQVIPIHQKICNNCGHVHEMKKKKQDIMKNLNKITPILIKSIIENNDFNKFRPWNQDIQFQIGKLTPKLTQSSQNRLLQLNKTKSSMSRRKSNTSQQQKQKNNTSYLSQNIKCFKQTNNPNFQYLQTNKPISCIGVSNNWLAFTQNISKYSQQLQQKQPLTISAYKLQNYNLVGINYYGECNIYYTYTSNNKQPSQYIFDSINIKKCIIKMKVFSNLIVLLTGQSTLLILSLPYDSKKRNNSLSYQLNNTIQIIQPVPDRITAFQFLRATVNTNQQYKIKQSNILLVVGTLYGRISIYKIINNQYHIIRYIPNAHNQMITSISQCPLNNNNQILLASGCYDGTVSIWDTYQTNPIFTYECSNKKIWSIYWDPGAKFIFINRDQIVDNCIIICFYSINKIETSIHLANTIQTRTVKFHKCKLITHHDYYSKSLPLLDPVKGIFKLLQLQQLRSNSLKKKKPKKQDIMQKLYKIHFNNNDRNKKVNSSIEIQQINLTDEQTHQALQQVQTNANKKFPIFSDIAIQCKEKAQYIYMSSYNGTILVFKNQNK